MTGGLQEGGRARQRAVRKRRIRLSLIGIRSHGVANWFAENEAGALSGGREGDGLRWELIG
jgi:hypothetical protein